MKTQMMFGFLLAGLFANPAHAQFNVQHDGGAAFCATGLRVSGSTYDFIGTCSTPPPPPGTCAGPAGMTRLLRSNVSYGVLPTPLRSVDTTELVNIWGHYNTTDAVRPWPGVSGSGPTLRSFGRTNFLAAHFRTGATATGNGMFWYPVNLPAPNVDMTISTSCGDFSVNTANPACSVINVASADNRLVSWSFRTNSPNFNCGLRPNTDYYVNMKYHDPQSLVECAVGSPICPMPSISYFSP